MPLKRAYLQLVHKVELTLAFDKSNKIVGIDVWGQFSHDYLTKLHWNLHSRLGKPDNAPLMLWKRNYWRIRKEHLTNFLQTLKINKLY